MTAQRKAKTLTEEQFRDLLVKVRLREHGVRDIVMLLLSFKCGLRACEIARLQWSDVTDADGKLLPVNAWIELSKHITKGKKPDTRVLMHRELYAALLELRSTPRPKSVKTLMYSPRGDCMTVNALTVYMHRLFAEYGLKGCSSHSGRKTFITNLSRICNLHGSSIKDVQLLARHSDIRTTETYIEPAPRIAELAAAA